MSEKPEQTPREILATLAAMSPEEFSAFMAWHFEQLCKGSPQASEDVGGRQDG